MNCKPGDLAIIVRSESGNHGCIVECITFYANAKFMGHRDHVNCWGVRGALRNPDRSWPAIREGVDGVIPDAWLRPLRDSDGEDEMLRIAGKPITHEVLA